MTKTTCLTKVLFGSRCCNAQRACLLLDIADRRSIRACTERCTPGASAGAGDAAQSGTDGDMAAAVQQIAEMALLGAGCADVMFPASLDEMYEQADELVFRVAL